MNRTENIISQIVPTWVKRTDGDGIEYYTFKHGVTVYDMYLTGYVVKNDGSSVGVAKSVKELRALLKGV